MTPPQNMADVLLLPLAKSLNEKLENSFIFQPTITYTDDQANSAISVEYELKTIQNNMEAVYDVLVDAEKKQFTNNSVKVWLRELKCIIYDIDDLIDEATTECLQHNVKNGNFHLNVRYPFCSFHLSQDIQKIGAKLACLVDRKGEFELVEAQDEPSNQKIWDHCNKIKDFFYQYDSIIIGRNEAKHEIMSKVFSVSNESSLSVLPIVAKGGIGKTTLAKSVYSDIPNFDIKLWACVSHKFYINNILAKILQGNDVNVEGSSRSFEELIEKIGEFLNGKKYFLVLDDMWLEDKLEWKKLEKYLSIGKEGSMILITTRNVKVASITKTMEPYKLGGLLENDCWSIFRQMSFEGFFEEVRYPKLQKIGKTIASECWGVPLVVKVLASMLRFERDAHVWKRIRDINLNNNDEYDVNKPMKLLKLSYDSFRPQLKQCFAYLSLYPNNYVYDSMEMLDIGIALGLFKQESNGIRESEEVAQLFLKELTLNSLLSIEEQQKCKRSSIEGFKLHDIMHDLATDIMEDELADVVTTEHMPIISYYTRHVIWRQESVSDSLSPKELPTELAKAIKARTFRLCEVNRISQSMVEEIISKFVYLRVLDLSGALLDEVPNSVGKLKHLRYLNLSENVLIQGLPGTICNLVNLDTFHTKGCVRLKELLKDMHLLLRLRKFSVTTLQESLINTKIKNLVSIEHLEIHSCPRLASLWGSSGSTEGLTSLRSLNISYCPKLKRLSDSIKLLVNLEQLTLHDCEELDLEEGQEGLEGLQNLKELYISLLPKLARLPHAIIQSTKTTLETLELVDCKGLIHLVDPLKDCFGEFESLGRIIIKRCPRLFAFPNSICRLDTLEDIVIVESPQLAKSCSLTPESKALDFTLIHQVLNIQIDDAILTKQRNQPNQYIRDPLRTSIMTFWENAVGLTPKKQHDDQKLEWRYFSTCLKFS